jgi:hypothetical protein
MSELYGNVASKKDGLFRIFWSIILLAICLIVISAVYFKMSTAIHKSNINICNTAIRNTVEYHGDTITFMGIYYTPFNTFRSTSTVKINVNSRDMQKYVEIFKKADRLADYCENLNHAVNDISLGHIGTVEFTYSMTYFNGIKEAGVEPYNTSHLKFYDFDTTLTNKNLPNYVSIERTIGKDNEYHFSDYLFKFRNIYLNEQHEKLLKAEEERQTIEDLIRFK